jgi:hypothetical protein
VEIGYIYRIIASTAFTQRNAIATAILNALKSIKSYLVVVV